MDILVNEHDKWHHTYLAGFDFPNTHPGKLVRVRFHRKTISAHPDDSFIIYFPVSPYRT